MNNGTVPNPLIISGTDNQLISEAYEGITETRIFFSSFILLIYASFLHSADEVEYIWKRKITLPTVLYVFSKYPALISQALQIVNSFLTSLRVCNDVGILDAVVNIFPLVGVQGLISIRTYSLCRGYRPMAIALSITFLAPLAVQIYTLTIPQCNPISQHARIVFLVRDSTVILTDILAFIGVLYQVWGLWRLKRSLGFRSGESLAVALFRQGILRFSFVIILSSVQTVLTLVQLRTTLVENAVTTFQNVLSTLLICEFAIDLRRRNARASATDRSVADLPTLSFQENQAQSSIRTVLGRINQSILIEMGESDDPTDIDNLTLHSVESDDLRDDLYDHTVNSSHSRDMS